MRRKGHEHMIAIIDYDAGNIKERGKSQCTFLGQEVDDNKRQRDDFKGRSK